MLKHRILIGLLYNCGLRCKKVRTLGIRDIDLNYITGTCSVDNQTFIYFFELKNPAFAFFSCSDTHQLIQKAAKDEVASASISKIEVINSL